MLSKCHHTGSLTHKIRVSPGLKMGCVASKHHVESKPLEFSTIKKTTIPKILKMDCRQIAQLSFLIEPKIQATAHTVITYE